MKEYLWRLLPVLAIMIVLPTTAMAGKITTVSADPDPATVGEEVTFTINGSGFCARIWFDPGDGAGGQEITAPLNFPKEVKHIYTVADTYTVNVWSEVGGCQGTALMSLTVNEAYEPIPIGGGGNVERLYEALKNRGNVREDGLRALNPKIENFIGWTLGPGRAFAVSGSGFGNYIGGKSRIILKGDLPGWDGILEVIEWHSGMIGAKVPEGLSGLHDLSKGEAFIQVITGWDKKSNEWPTAFQAELEVKLLYDNDPVVRVVSCGDDGNLNECNDVSIEGDWCAGPGPPFTGRVVGATITSYHWNCGTIGDDVGDDVYEINLKNGWVIDSVKVQKDSSSSDDVIDDPWPAATQGMTSWLPTFHWKATPADSVSYGVDVYIIGPKGVPHH